MKMMMKMMVRVMRLKWRMMMTRLTVRMMMKRMTRRIMIMMGVTSFFEAARSSEMDGRPPMTSPSRAQLVAILQVFLCKSGEHNIYVCSPQRFKRE